MNDPPCQQSLDSHPQHSLTPTPRIAIRVEESHIGTITLPSRQFALCYPHVPWRKYECTWYHHKDREDHDAKEK